MNKQETFDKVVTHMLTQNARALLSSTSSCAYRGGDSKMCAVGCLIPDDLYDKEFEEHDVSEIFEHYPVLAKYITPDELSGDDAYMFLSSLQSIHDQVEVQNWRTSLTNFATETGLKNTAIALIPQ